MQYHSSYNISPPVYSAGFSQRLSGRRLADLPGGSTLWWAAAKVASVMVVLAAICSFGVSFAISGKQDEIAAIHEQQHQLRDQQITLLAERANLMSRQQVQERAGTQLALYIAENDQVLKLR